MQAALLCLDSKSRESKIVTGIPYNSLLLCLDSKSRESKIALGNQLSTSWLPELDLFGKFLCRYFFCGLAVDDEGSLPLCMCAWTTFMFFFWSTFPTGRITEGALA